MDPLTLASVASTIINPFLQAGQNQSNRNFSEHLYDKQRADALADRDFQNNYNSPAANMARLKAAGLNPNLVYGNGNAISQSAQTRSSSADAPKGEAPNLNFQSAFQAAQANQQIQESKARTNNIAALTEVANEDKNLKMVQTLATLEGIPNTQADVATKKYNLNNTMPANLNIMKQELQNKIADYNKTEAETKVSLDKNEREAVMQSYNISSALENIYTLRLNRAKTTQEINEIKEKISNIKADTTLKELDAELKKEGIQPHDPYYMRALKSTINEIDKGYQVGKTSIKEILKSFLQMKNPQITK